MKQSQREIVVAQFIGREGPDKSGNYKKVGDKTRPYGNNHAVSREGRQSQPWSRGITGQPGMRRALNASITSLKA